MSAESAKEKAKLDLNLQSLLKYLDTVDERLKDHEARLAKLERFTEDLAKESEQSEEEEEGW